LLTVELAPVMLPSPGQPVASELSLAAGTQHLLQRLSMQGGLVWWRHAGFDPLQYHLYRLLEGESWFQWQAFRRSPSTVLPLGPAGHILLLVRAGFTDKTPLRASGGRAPLFPATRSFQYVEASQAGGEALLRFLAYSPPTRSLGLLDLGSEGVAKRFNLAAWLLEDEGVFSARPWSWENFLPRMFSVAGILAFGLLLVEFLRVVARLGLRTLGGGGRRDEPEARAYR
jgi:hypothetical protein